MYEYNAILDYVTQILKRDKRFKILKNKKIYLQKIFGRI